MASGGQPAESLSIKVWELKTSIHCAGCQKKIKKILNNIEGVMETEIDASQSKVTVKAIVDSQVLIKRLAKHGKHAQLFPQPKPPAANQTEPITETNTPIPAEPKQPPETPEKPTPPPPPATKTAVAHPTEPTEEQQHPPPKPSETSATADTKPTEKIQTTEDSKAEPPNSSKATENLESNEKEVKEESSDERMDVSGDVQQEKPVVQLVYHDYHHPVYSPELQLSYNMVQPSVSHAYYASPVTAGSRGEEYVYSPEYLAPPPEYYYGQAMEGSSSAAARGYESMSMFSEENPNACNLM